jgi:SNF2 family DNA or RNA helicase
MVYRLVATDTIEEKVMELKARKAALFAQVVDGDGVMSTAVTADDVRALLGE